MKEYKVPIQSLIDHIKTAVDVDPWAKEMAEELLKEQEAVEPILKCEGWNKKYNDYVCPRCDNNVVYEQNYCSECGIPFLWGSR